MAPRYPILATSCRAELEVLGSRFIALGRMVDGEPAAHRLVDDARREFPDATHHCSAFLVGPPGSTRTVGFSDDGEPHNTAGRPIFDVLLHSGIGDIAVVVVRYFGGTKLGRGGLVRAYGGAVQALLEAATTTPKITWAERTLELDYASLKTVRHLLPAHEAEVVDAAFGAQVRLEVRVPEENLARLEEALENAGRGAWRLRNAE